MAAGGRTARKLGVGAALGGLWAGVNLLRAARVVPMDSARSRTESSIASGGRLAGGVDSAVPTDEDLLNQFRLSEDARAYELLVHRYERELFSYLRRYLGSAEMAEDVFQATFLQVYLKKEKFEEGRRFRPWLYTIATNQAIDAQRRNRRHRMVSLDQRTGGEDDVGTLLEMMSGVGPTANEQMEGEEAREWVRRAVDDLPETLRAALVLIYHQGLKYREAADVLGIPVGTVKSRLHAALLKLNQSWQASGQEAL
jgi:RNA polymerase sigma-70 factor (ECF subfamily)